MSLLQETTQDRARAKLNLTLAVLGRRDDGFHELESLVAFADIGDRLALQPRLEPGLDVEGPFAAAIGGENLVEHAIEQARLHAPDLSLGHFTLDKQLPIAAGLGGGSADAAAALRLLARANPGKLGEQALSEIAAELGSDVLACLASRPVFMRGRGERLDPVPDLPPCGVLLANPGIALSAGDVYRAGAFAALPEDFQVATEVPEFKGSFSELTAFLEARGNDLQPPALQLAPNIAAVLSALAQLPGARCARLSGSGATCFALFSSLEAAEAAEQVLAASHPEWWIAAGTLGD